MKRAEWIRIGSVFLALVFASCSGMKISSEKSPGADLSHYKTYAWASLSREHSRDSVLDQNIRESLDQELRKNGFLPVAADAKPDFFVDYSVTSREKTQVQPSQTAVGVGGPYWHGYMAMPPTVTTYREGSLIVDFYDGRSQVAFWRGTAEAQVENRSQVTDAVREAARKILAEYKKDETESATA